MKKVSLMSLIFCCFLLIANQTIFAHERAMPSDNSMKISKILKDLQSNGYTDVSKVSYHKDGYEVKAMDKNGKESVLKVDAANGKVISSKEASHAHKKEMTKMKLTALDVAEKVEAAGYHGIGKIKAKDGHYLVIAFDKNNKKVMLKVDGNSGSMTEHKAGW